MRTIRSTPDGRPAPPTTLKPDGSARTRVRAAHPIDAALGIDALPKLSAPSTAEIMWRELAPRTPRERAFSVASPRPPACTTAARAIRPDIARRMLVGLRLGRVALAVPPEPLRGLRAAIISPRAVAGAGDMPAALPPLPPARASPRALSTQPHALTALPAAGAALALTGHGVSGARTPRANAAGPPPPALSIATRAPIARGAGNGELDASDGDGALLPPEGAVRTPPAAADKLCWRPVSTNVRRPLAFSAATSTSAAAAAARAARAPPHHAQHEPRR
ncbi:hypothetical protein KFE25_009672 [Diacronema lutheri]|uniref:Uncharacterized protein n=1 Tax=Diacronema lutheri TaxID=2081491 RepID=A0A8J5XKX9_DIALT|nr:hypothetical protein KFE25_009672 [Diacronema lutheri]